MPFLLPGLPGPVRRVARWTRVLLGPSRPLPPDLLPPPTASISLSCSTPRRAYSFQPDPWIRRHTAPLRHLWVLVIVLCAWFIGNIFLIRQQYYLPYTPSFASCTGTFWNDWPPDTCGINGTECASALTGGPSDYRCLASCHDTTLGNPRWIGDQQVNGVPLVIGGGGPEGAFRADSWACAAGFASDLISTRYGGCITLTPLPFPSNITSFPSISGTGITTIPFLGYFPGAFTVTKSSAPGCKDLHTWISTFNALMLFFTTLLLHPRPSILFGTILLLGYFQIVMVSDPPNQPPDWPSIIGGLLPVVFAGYWAYRVAFRTTLMAFGELPLDTSLWQGLGFWIGIESSTIFAKLPISRLGYDRLDPGGVTTLTIIVVLVFIVVCFQAWDMRKMGLLQYYILWYIPLAPILVVLAVIPGYTLRIHHYIYSLAAIPVLGLPNRVSLFFQAFMLGLFLDGIGRWGWASILQQTASLLGDAAAGSIMPLFTPSNSTDLISWSDPNNSTLLDQGVTGISLLVDDILWLNNANISNTSISDLGLDTHWDHYFRIAYFANGSSLDWTDPWTRFPNGSWIDS